MISKTLDIFVNSKLNKLDGYQHFKNDCLIVNLTSSSRLVNVHFALCNTSRVMFYFYLFNVAKF